MHAIASIQSILGSAAAGGNVGGMAADGVNGNNPRNTSTNLGPEVRMVVEQQNRQHNNKAKVVSATLAQG